MEVIVAVIVLGTGIVMLSQGLTAAIRSAARVQRVTRAAVVADEIFQRMESGEIDFMTETEGDLLSVGPMMGFSGAGEEEESHREVFRWKAQVEQGTLEDLWRVTLSVSWSDASENETFFEAVRLFYVPPEDEEEEE
jgi:hypothetical protein